MSYPSLFAHHGYTAPLNILTQSNRYDVASRYTSWVADAVTAIEQLVAPIEPRVTRRTGDHDYETAVLPFTHPLRRLLARPLPGVAHWTGLQHRQLAAIYLHTQGNAYWFKSPAYRPRELWPVPAQYAYVEHGANGLPSRLCVLLPGMPRPKHYPLDDVLWLKRPNPLNPLGDGLSPIAQHMPACDIHDALQRTRTATFRRGQKPGLCFTTDQLLDDDTVARLEARIAAKFEGDDKWYRPLIMEAGLTPNPWTLKPAELDFLDSGRFNREELLAMFRVPLILLGLGDTIAGMSQAAWQGAITMFTRSVCDPYLATIAAQETSQLARDWGDDITITYPTTQPTDRNMQRADEAVDRREALRSIDEIRIARGLTPLGGKYADPSWRPGPLAAYHADPAGDAQPTDRSTTPPGPRPTDSRRLADPAHGDLATV